MQQIAGCVPGRGILTDLTAAQIDAVQTFPTLARGDSDAVRGTDEVTDWGYRYGDIPGT